MASGVDQVTGGLSPASYNPWGRPGVPGDSGQCASARDVDHPSWVTLAGVRGPAWGHCRVVSLPNFNTVSQGIGRPEERERYGGGENGQLMDKSELCIY